MADYQSPQDRLEQLNEIIEAKQSQKDILDSMAQELIEFHSKHKYQINFWETVVDPMKYMSRNLDFELFFLRREKDGLVELEK